MTVVTKGYSPSHMKAELDFEGSNWVKARKRFENSHNNDRKNTDQLQLQEFLKSRTHGEEVKEVCLQLQKDAGSKYHSGFGSILENINTLMTVGDLAIKSAPESVGLAWTGIRMCLHAVQGDWSTFQLFSGACADIIGIMISCRVYGKMYGERNEDNDLEDFHELHAKVIDYIPDIYTEILEFSYQVRKYTDKHIVIRIGKNIFKDTRNDFEAKIRNIKASDETMRSFARTASDRMTLYLAKKNLKGQDEMKSEIASLKGILESSLKSNEAVVRRAFDELEEERKSMRKKTPYEKAQDRFEENMTHLDPTADQYELLRENIDVKREPGTCQWLIKDKDYQKWRDSTDNSMIWISGAGGYGKSILVSTVIETIRAETTNSDKEIVQYFFCKAGSDDTQSTTRILKTIVAQLYTHSLPSPDLLERTNEVVSHGLTKQISKNRTEARFDFVAIFSGLIRIMNRTVFLVIDAIDECVDRKKKQLLKSLRELTKIKEANIKIMVCSRPEPDIADALSRVVNVKCEGRNKDDIRKNVAMEMRKFPGWTASERAAAVEQVEKKSGGQFRYVQIALDFLRKPLVRPYDRELARLPDSLTGSYTSSWEATDKNYLALLKTALTWTLFADGPVSVPEIMDAYSRAYGQEADGEAEVESYSPADGEVNLHDRQIRTAGGSFLEVSSSRTVSLRHLTVRDFFVPQEEMVESSNAKGVSQRSPWTISAREGHLEMVKTLVQHLASPAFQKKYLSSHVTTNEDDQLPHPPVITDNSPIHIVESGDDIVALRRICAEAEAQEKADRAERNTTNDHDESDVDSDEESDDEDINHELANHDYYFSDIEDEEDLWDKNIGRFNPLKQSDEDEDTSHDKVQPQARYETTYRPRYEITHWTYHLSEAQKLWSWEEQRSNASWSTIWNCLVKFMCEDSEAFQSWQTIVFSNQQKPSNATSSKNEYHYGTPLQIASFFDLTSLAKILIERGHKVTERKLFLFTHPASDLGWGSLIAKYNTSNCLDVAVRKQKLNTDMIKICVENGCDLNDLETWSPPFQTAILHEPSYEFVKYLMDHGAKVDIEDGDEYYPIHRFSESGTDPRVLQLLLDTGADINEAAEGQSPLHILTSREDVPLPLLEAYLEAGAKVNSEDWDSQRPLINLIRRDNYEAIKLLIDLGADVNDDDKQGRTAMHWVARCGNLGVLDLLVAKGASLNQPDRRQRTPFFYACQYNNTEIAEKLLQYLINKPVGEINRRDHRNRTPFRQAAGHGNIEVIRSLLSMSDGPTFINLCDQDMGSGLGQNSLHKAAHNGQKQTLEFLLAQGGDLSITDNWGLSPFDLCLRAWTNTRSKSKLKSLEDTLLLLVSQSKESESKEKKELMFRAVMKGSLRIVQSLLEGGLDADIKDEFGWTPLMVAEQWQQYAIIDIIKSSSRKASPSRWLPIDEAMRPSENGLQARIWPTHRYASLTIVSDQPIPVSNSKYYFEIEVRGLYERSCIILGLTSLPTKLKGGKLGGRSSGIKSCGWRGKDGRLSGEEKVLDGSYATFGSGDTVGCAVDLKEHTIFFTKNGDRLEIAFRGVFGRLHPAFTAEFGELGNSWPNLAALVRANFGGDLVNKPFKWEGLAAWYRAK